jgi:hypothetical protein
MSTQLLLSRLHGHPWTTYVTRVQQLLLVLAPIAYLLVETAPRIRY